MCFNYIFFLIFFKFVGGGVSVSALLMLGLVVFAGVWRLRWSRRARARFLDRYPYKAMLDFRLAQRRPELFEAQRQQVLEGLRVYFHLCNSAGRNMISMPSQAVDDAWHEFILFTRRYARFCQRGFGRFLHHTPAEAMSSPTQASDGLKRVWRLSCRREGIDPANPSRLPLLFALDAGLGISGGFVYKLDCMAKGETGTGFCASHIGGCGGGCAGGGSGDSGDSGDGGSGCGGGCGGGGGD